MPISTQTVRLQRGNSDDSISTMAHLQKSYKEQEITKDELACIYSALILADDDIPITQEKIQTLLRVAKVEVSDAFICTKMHL